MYDINVPVLTDVSPDLHPDVVGSISGFDGSTAPYLRPLFDALHAAYLSVNKIYAARDALNKDKSRTPEGVVIELAEYAERQEKQVARKMDSVMQAMRKTIAGLEAELSKPLVTDAERHTTSGEVRAHFKALDDGSKRTAQFQALLEEGDVVALRAVLGASPFLSGMSRKEQALWTRIYHEQFEPEKARLLQAMRQAEELLMKRSTLFIAKIQEAVGGDWRRVQTLRAARQEADRAVRFDEELH